MYFSYQNSAEFIVPNLLTKALNELENWRLTGIENWLIFHFFKWFSHFSNKQKIPIHAFNRSNSAKNKKKEIIHTTFVTLRTWVFYYFFFIRTGQSANINVQGEFLVKSNWIQVKWTWRKFRFKQQKHSFFLLFTNNNFQRKFLENRDFCLSTIRHFDRINQFELIQKKERKNHKNQF